MSKKLLNFIFLVGISFSTIAQDNIKDYVIKNCETIKTIQPDSFDYSDIEIIGKAIGDSRIVMLGEQSHGDVPTFYTKTRLIKYLHEKKGFNVLAFEADFYALLSGWKLLMKKEIETDSFPSFLKQNIHAEWTHCSACDNLFKEYIPQQAKTNSPLIITGFDNQPLGSFSRKNLITELDSFLTSQNISFIQKPEYKNNFIPILMRYFSFKYSKDSFIYAGKILIPYLNIITKQLSESKLRNEYWELNVSNIKSYIVEGLYYNSHKIWDSKNTRDEQMAQNLKWIVRSKYPTEKIIVWAASYHIIKKSSSIIPHNSKHHSMGEFFIKDSLLNNTSYVLGFNSKNGTAGPVVGTYHNTPYPVGKPKKNSFENWIPKDIHYAFVDFKNFKYSKKRFNMKGMKHINRKANWTEGFDGLFYIRDTYSCIGLK